MQSKNVPPNRLIMPTPPKPVKAKEKQDIEIYFQAETHKQTRISISATPSCEYEVVNEKCGIAIKIKTN